MKKSDSGNFFLAFILNLVFNIEWVIPAVLLLILHFTVGLPIFWFWLALGLWIGGMLVVTLVLGWAGKCSEPPPPKENKNPYSQSSFPMGKDKNSGNKA